LVTPLISAGAGAGQFDPDWRVTRTPDGHPDLQGVWANNNATPLERPEVWAGKETLSAEEFAGLQVAAANAFGDGDALFGDQLVLAAGEGIEPTSYDPTTGNYDQFWTAERDFSNQTSLVVDPPDGRISDLTPGAQARRRAATTYHRDYPADSYTDRPLQECCVTYEVLRLGAGRLLPCLSERRSCGGYARNDPRRPCDKADRSQSHLTESVRRLHGNSLGHGGGARRWSRRRTTQRRLVSGNRATSCMW